MLVLASAQPIPSTYECHIYSQSVSNAHINVTTKIMMNLDFCHLRSFQI